MKRPILLLMLLICLILGASQLTIMNSNPGVKTIAPIYAKEEIQKISFDSIFVNTDGYYVTSATGVNDKVKLIDNYTLYFNGAQYVNLLRPSKLNFIPQVDSFETEGWFQIEAGDTGTLYGFGVGVNLSDRQFQIFAGATLAIVVGGRTTSFPTAIGLDGEPHHIKVQCLASASGLNVWLDGTQYVTNGEVGTATALNNAYYGARTNGISYTLTGYLWNWKHYSGIGDDRVLVAQHNFSEGDASSVYDLCETPADGTKGNDTGWTTLEKATPSNAIFGFDLWTNDSTSDTLMVPFDISGISRKDSTSLIAGYSWVSSNPAGNWHNQAESKLVQYTGLEDYDPDFWYSSGVAQKISWGSLVSVGEAISVEVNGVKKTNITTNGFTLINTSLTIHNPDAVVHCLGSSSTFGYGLNYDEKYPFVLNTLLDIDDIVYNNGVNGDKTSEMLDRLQVDILDDTESTHMIEFGAENDMASGISALDTIAHLQSIYSQCKNNGIIVVACKIKPWRKRMETLGGYPEWQAKTDSVNIWMETANDVDYVIDTYTLFEYPVGSDSLNVIYDQGDGIHPNAAGASLLANEIFENVNW